MNIPKLQTFNFLCLLMWIKYKKVSMLPFTYLHQYQRHIFGQPSADIIIIKQTFTDQVYSGHFSLKSIMHEWLHISHNNYFSKSTDITILYWRVKPGHTWINNFCRLDTLNWIILAVIKNLFRIICIQHFLISFCLLYSLNIFHDCLLDTRI